MLLSCAVLLAWTGDRLHDLAVKLGPSLLEVSGTSEANASDFSGIAVSAGMLRRGQGIRHPSTAQCLLKTADAAQ